MATPLRSDFAMRDCMHNEGKHKRWFSKKYEYCDICGEPLSKTADQRFLVCPQEHIKIKQ